MSTSSPVLFSVIDVETTISGGSSSPFHPDNTIVLFGTCSFLDTGESRIYTRKPSRTEVLNVGKSETKIPMLVGHNFKFDLHHLRRHMPDKDFQALIDRPIWDTQIAEYILTSQQHQWASLDELSTTYGLVTKADEGFAKIKAAFERGEGADTIDSEMLENYLKHDLRITGEVALQQMNRATPEQFNLIVTMGESLKATQEMEYNGMYCDKKLVDKMSMDIIDTLAKMTIDVNMCMENYVKGIRSGADKEIQSFLEVKDNWYGNPTVMSALLFGGTLKWDTREAIGVYKTGAKKGKVRYKVLKNEFTLPPAIMPLVAGSTETKRKGVYTVDEAVIANARGILEPGTPLADMLDNVLEMKKLGKLYSTYLSNFSTMVGEDGILHHQLNQCATATGRLSSSNPNLQNVPMPDKHLSHLNVKRCFTSGYGEDGVILEIDFKQLEVCVLAWLTKDPQLMHDIAKGVDIHTAIGERVYGAGKKISKRQRREVKAVVFAMLYGAGAKGIAKTSGMPLERVQRIMNEFYDRYSTIRDTYDAMSDKVPMVEDEIYRDKDHQPRHWWELKMAHGRSYWLHSDPYRRGPKFTELRNYPVQGTATGDIVPALLGEVRKLLVDREDVKMITTTHDSVTLDCASYERAIDIALYLDRMLFSRLDVVINEIFPTMGWDIPLTLEYEIGPSWGELKEVDIHA